MLLRRSFRAAGAQRHLHPRFLHLVASPEEAVACVRDNDAVYVHTAAATPQALTRAWTSEVLRRGLTCTAVHLHTMGDAPWLAPSSFPAISGRCLFVGANARDAVAQGRASYVPLSLSEMPRLFANGALRVDVALISVSPPDAHGWCSLGPSVDVTRSAIRAARVVVAQVNARMPRTFGAAALHASAIHVAWRCDEPLPTALSHAPRAAAAEAGDHHAASVEARIGALVAERLVPDGATLQVGIGSVPDAVLVSLRGHRDLGVHSELISDGIAELTRAGVVTNRFKAVQPGLTVTGFAVASAPHFYDFLHDNAGVTFRGFSFTNDPRVIARNPNVVALNSAIEVDLSGQAVGDACGHHVMSGVGGQVRSVWSRPRLQQSPKMAGYAFLFLSHTP